MVDARGELRARTYGANAAEDSKLYAAAPDLYAALRDCLESLNRLPDADASYRVTCIAQARSALSKAEGGAAVKPSRVNPGEPDPRD